MPTMLTHYDVLAVGREASQPDIKQAFRRLAKRYHPDTNPEQAKKAAGKLKDIITAYRVLSNERERARYDALLQAGPMQHDPERHTEEDSLKKTAERILDDLLAGDSERGVTAFDEASADGGFHLLDYLDARDYLDCVFLLAEQYEHQNRFTEAVALYEELYEREKDPPRKRYFFDEVKARIKKLYSRKLPREAMGADEEIACYERILQFDLDKSEQAFILKKIAEVHCRIGDTTRAKEIFTEALALKPGLKGTATIREILGMTN